MEREELKIGSKVYYGMEDYDTGEDVLYEGYVIGFEDNHSLKIDDKRIKLDRFYNISDTPNGEMIIGMQRNCLYTIKDLWGIKNKYEEVILDDK